MRINSNTWTEIESRINKFLNEKEKTEQQKSKVYGQKPSNREKGYKKRTNK